MNNNRDYTFDIPDGYQVVDEADNMLSMEAYEDHSVIVYALDNAGDLEFSNHFLIPKDANFQMKRLSNQEVMM